jgi:hypothetical protein
MNWGQSFRASCALEIHRVHRGAYRENRGPPNLAEPSIFRKLGPAQARQVQIPGSSTLWLLQLGLLHGRKTKEKMSLILPFGMMVARI